AIKNVFVPFLPDESSVTTAAVDVAVSMAAQASAHLTVRAFTVEHVPPYSVMPEFVGALAAKVNEDEREATARIGTHLDAMLRTVGFPTDVACVQKPHTTLVELTGLQARTHDLAVIDAPVDYVTFQQAMFEELVFQTGRPVIIAPKGCSAFSAKRIMVAWDGSPRAARALNDAMPFLKGAEHVELASVVNEKTLKNAAPGAEIAPHLSRHGIDVEVVDIKMKSDAGSALTERAELVGADLIVAGAYAHSRWRHLVLGGVTTSLLRGSRTCVFMSH
ncbi:MAG: universal stress protein, partial [Beijerinckiaceae bacterium]